jgi:hypothetical protein
MQQRWPESFRCPCCGYDSGYFISTRNFWECSQEHKQTSVTAGNLFHITNLPLTKWFGVIYLIASGKGGVSALWLSKQINVCWIAANRMLPKIRIAMGHQDRIYRLHDLIEIDDALIGRRHSEESTVEAPEAKRRG